MSLFGRLVNWRGRWRRGSSYEATPREAPLLPRAMLAMLEDVLSWENPQLSLSFLAFVNIVFLVFVHMSISFLECVFIIGMMVTCLDGLETWLRAKHRTACLEKLAQCDNTRLQNALAHSRIWLACRMEDFLAMREANPTKAFLLINIILGTLLVVGKTISGALLLYLMAMTVILFPVASPLLVRFMNKIRQASESEGDIDSLIPELSDQNIKELNFESDSVPDTRQSVEKWLPEGAPPGDSSDSDDDSRSSAGALPVGSAAALDARDTTDSSDDEYLPQSEEEKLVSTVEVLQPVAPSIWGGTTVGALWSLSGALSTLVSRATPPPAHTDTEQRKLISSTESSDDFEFLDQSDL